MSRLSLPPVDHHSPFLCGIAVHCGSITLHSAVLVRADLFVSLAWRQRWECIPGQSVSLITVGPVSTAEGSRETSARMIARRQSGCRRRSGAGGKSLHIALSVRRQSLCVVFAGASLPPPHQSGGSHLSAHAPSARQAIPMRPPTNRQSLPPPGAVNNRLAQQFHHGLQ